ncbi:hypothetical protein OSB04_009673 [Centaurea solstitialis]|uniref:Polygalacturonase n=1 Tax=Centaurea solstitialis TaxID=347529 RepID=A0AA38T629_9ASTR|nr:hypothetical protein OSB04_009673 [Centaurea solstitialis]
MRFLNAWDLNSLVVLFAEFLMIFVLSLCYVSFGPRTASAANFEVTSYGAKGDGNTDDSKALHFHACNGLRVRGTTHINSPKMHICINGCEDVDIGHIGIITPANSPNTDGIDISKSSHVNIHDSNIQTGIVLHQLHKDTDYNEYRESDRDKSSNGNSNLIFGTGFARGIVYRKIHLVNVRNPIIIDQHYCSNSESVGCPSPPSTPAVQVSNVKYDNIHGSSASAQAITFRCSRKFKCTGIETNGVGITGNNVFSVCKNVEGNFVDTNPPIKCSQE